MYSRSHRAVAILAVVVFAALAGACAAVPASPPANTATLPAVSTPASGVEIRGVVLWGANPVAGARVDARKPDWRANPAADSTIATTTSGEDGSFVFADVPAGEWTLVASWPTGEESAGATPPVDTAATRITAILTRPQRATARQLLGPPLDGSKLGYIKLRAPELQGQDGWLNSKPLTMSQLRGQVVVLHFWTYG